MSDSPEAEFVCPDGNKLSIWDWRGRAGSASNDTVANIHMQTGDVMGGFLLSNAETKCMISALDRLVRRDPSPEFAAAIRDELDKAHRDRVKLAFYGSGKPNLTLLPFDALGEVAAVFQIGVDKYGANNWMEENNGGGDHVAAALRHLGKHCDGEVLDESGKTHLDHAAARLLMAIGKRLRGAR